MEDVANAQVEANRNTERGQRQERLKNAIEHLGDQSDSVRLGGAYELFHLAVDTDYLRQTVLDILCAHIRRTTSEEEYKEKHQSGPSEEIQSIFSLLSRERNQVFHGLRINLKGSWLCRAELSDIQMQGADLFGARLQGVACQSHNSDTFGERIQEQVETNSDLSEIVFAGGLTEETLCSSVDGLSPSAAKRLSNLLKSHIGHPVYHMLPEDSGAVTEPAYTIEEAGQWIADYEAKLATRQ